MATPLLSDSICRLNTQDSARGSHHARVVQSFVQRIELSAKSNSLAAYFYALPTGCSFELVAGARYEPVQIELRPLERFMAGLRKAA
jgi:hypothetical protein